MQINLLVLNLLLHLYQKQTLKLKAMKTTSNKSAKTYTIRVNGNKYRTLQMSKQEFDSAYYWTDNDWKQFLKTDEYYSIK
jgi:hypothetical protein